MPTVSVNIILDPLRLHQSPNEHQNETSQKTEIKTILNIDLYFVYFYVFKHYINSSK